MTVTKGIARRFRFMLLATAAAVLIVVAWYMVASELPSSDDLSTPALLTGVVIVILVPGLVAEWRRPRDPVAWLVVLLGLASGTAAFRGLEPRWAATLGAAMFYALPLLACDVLLRLTSGLGGNTTGRAGRAGRTAGTGGTGGWAEGWGRVAACWFIPVVLATGILAVTGPRRTTAGFHAGGLRAASWVFKFDPGDGHGPARWTRQGNLLHVVNADGASHILWALWSIVIVVTAWATVAVVARRRAAAQPAEARTARLLTAAAVAVAVGVTVDPVAAFPERLRLLTGKPTSSILHGHWYGDLVTVLPALAAAGLGAVLLWSELVRPRLGRETNGAIQLDAAATPASLGRQLARALGDPTARILFPRHDGTWIDDAGHAADPAAQPGRAATIVTREGEAVAAVEHDEWLLNQPDLLDVSVASVALTLEGRRLAALARASTEDIQASAVRLLDAAERARQDVERRIEDGPERTLATVGALLASDPVPLQDVHHGLRTAVAQVRDIAHGIAPAGLVEDGLGAALDDLCAAAGEPVTVAPLPAGAALAPSIEMTVYLVCRDAVHHAANPVEIGVALALRPGGPGEVTIRVDGWTGPIDQLVGDRIETLGGTITTGDHAITVSLPVSPPD